MVKKLIILGAGGFGREASLLVEDINVAELDEQWKLLGFVDDDKAKWGDELRGYPVLGGTEFLNEVAHNTRVITVIGNPENKKKVADEVSTLGLEFAMLVHPDILINHEIKIGEGSLINKGCLLTINIRIGKHVSINPGCGIGHDAIIGDFSTLMWRVNISGNVKIGEGCLIGTGATVLQGIEIGNQVTVGAGAVVTNDIPANCTAVGVPARVVKEFPSP